MDFWANFGTDKIRNDEAFSTAMLNARFITKVTGITLQRGTEAAHVKLPLAPTATAAAPYMCSNYLKWISGLKYSGN